MGNRATSARVARSEGVARLVAQLDDWAGGSGPLYRQLARAISAAVERGDLAPGARLPAERALAAAVSVSRGVVVAAYDELVVDGVIERRVGSGTFVAGAAVGSLPAGREGSELLGRLVDRAGAGDDLIDLSISIQHDDALVPEVAVATRGLAAVSAESPWGLPELRQRIAARVHAIGLPTVAEQVVVTTGAQQGISIAAGCWVRPGDRVVVDDPTNPGALAAFTAAGAQLRPVAVDRHGPVLAELAHELDAGPALAFFQSSVHSPTGARLSAHRRQAIARLLVEHRVPAVEDVALFAVDWAAGAPVAPVASLAPEHPIAVVGSYSKRFWAGLRVGFVRAPEPVAQRLVRVKATQDLGSSTVSQAVALALLDHPDHEAFLARRNAGLAARAALLAELVAEAVPGARVRVPDGGLSLWARLPRPVAPRLADACRAQGLVVATAAGLSARPGQHAERIRLTFALDEATLREAARRLGRAWSTLDDRV